MHGQRRRTCWVDATRVRRHLGAATGVRSTCRRNEGPQYTKSLGTHRPETGTARQIGAISVRRWWVERLGQARQGVVGLGQPPVTTQVERVERSVAVASMASLLLHRLRATHIPAARQWSALQRQRQFSWAGIQAQCARLARQLAWKRLPVGKAV